MNFEHLSSIVQITKFLRSTIMITISIYYNNIHEIITLIKLLIPYFNK